ncbi:MAG TPA: hypothetical protein VLM40_14000, partial [Gemmata sp.]|nr:hypothetical protein [Gemmata sp.]
MSSRTVTRMALAGLLSMAFAAPIAAQTTPPFAVSRTGTLVLPGSYSTIPPVELAPMPREAAKHGEIRVSIQFGGPKLIELKYEQKIYGEMPRAPMPHANYRGPCAAEDIIHGEGVILPTFGTAPPTVQAMPVTPEPVRGDFFFEEVIPGRVVSRPAVRLAQCLPDGCGRCTPQVEAMPKDMRVAYPRAVVTMLRCDESGTWWVESRGVPQPKHAQSQQNWYYGTHPVAQAPAPAAKPACCVQASSGICALTGSPRDGCDHNTCPFAGTWVREVDGAVIAATLSP